MYKYCIIIALICFPYTVQGAGSVHTAAQTQIGIFRNATPGRLGFRTAKINRKFLLNQKQIINFQWHESIPNRINTYGVHIEKIFYFNKMQFFFITYLYNSGKIGNLKSAVDFVIKDEFGSYQYHNLKEFTNINCKLSFAKIVNNTLFFAFSENQETVYMMELDSGMYGVVQYNHQAGVIQNIWLKAQGDAEYIFTSEKDKEIISGIFKITEEDSIELMEIYSYKVMGYDTRNGSLFYYNQDNILSYQNRNNSAGYAINEFMGKEERIYDVFFLEDDSFIIASTRSAPDRLSNLFFGNENLMHYFYYYHVTKHEQNGSFLIDKIKTFGSLWKLEQLMDDGAD
jgi:hypothetical protein